MTDLKNPTVVGIIVVTIIIICVTIYFYQWNRSLQEKVTNMENVLSTSIKEMNELREIKKGIPWLHKTLKEHEETINSLNETNAALVKEIKVLKRNLTLTVDTLNESGTVSVKFPKKKKASSKKKKKSKKNVSFEESASEDSDSSDESDSDEEEDDDISDVKKALEKMKKKKRRST